MSVLLAIIDDVRERIARDMRPDELPSPYKADLIRGELQRLINLENKTMSDWTRISMLTYVCNCM